MILTFALTIFLSAVAVTAQRAISGCGRLWYLDARPDVGACGITYDYRLLQTTVPQADFDSSQCGQTINIRDSTSGNSVHATVVGYCPNSFCQGDDITVTLAVSTALNEPEGDRPNVCWNTSD